jgi:predicted PurR-regulated permease PerM/methylmalonyl-CoA mutase cobalamin-binding subunit
LDVSPVPGVPPGPTGTIIVGAITVAALYFGREVLVPIALAFLLSFVLAPLVRLLRRLRMGRAPSVLIAVLLAFLVISGIGTLIGSQAADLAGNLALYESTITRKIESLQSAATGSGIIGRASTMLSDLKKEMTRTAEKAREDATAAPRTASGGEQPPKPIPVEIQAPPPAPFETIRSIIGPLAGPLATAGIVIVFLTFILLQREDLRDRFIHLVGGGDLQRTTQALDDGATRLSRFFLTQIAINAGFGVVIGTGLFFIGVPSAVLWGILAMLLRFLPYIGAWIAAFFPAALALAVDPTWSMLVWTLVLFAAVELLLSQGIEPLLNAHSTGLSALAVVVAATFWTWLWGPVGLLLSTPLTVCLVVLGRHVERLRFLDVLLGDQPALAPEESFYQRMLAGDPDEAAHQAEEFLKERSLADYYDEIAIKGLALAQSDARRGVLDRERRAEVKQTIEGLIDNLSGREEADLPKTTVLCVSGGGALDEAAAAMLAQVLVERGFGARVVPSHEVSPGNVFRLDAEGVETIVISYLDAGGFANARYLVRRLRRRLAPSATIVLGLWTQSEAAINRSDVVDRTEANAVVTSLAQAVEAVATRGKEPEAQRVQ